MSGGNADQRDFWTDEAGPTWVAEMAALDGTFAPVLDGVLVRAALRPGERVLDVGCGAGTSTQAAGAAVGAAGRAAGVDISDTLLAVARAQTVPSPQVHFEEVDAQVHRFTPASFDCLMSRFGVMFFSDTQGAFANMLRALRPGGRMCFATWGPIPENPFFTLPAAVAKRVLGPVPKSDPDAPGPFALRDADMVCGMLRAIGCGEVAVAAETIALTPPGDAGAVADLMCQIGPAARALSYHEAEAVGRAALTEALVAALAPYESAAGMRIPAGINFFTARKPA